MPSVGSIVLVIVAFIAMEPVTAATHRWVMHGIGEFLHRSHHRTRASRFEANDWYPVIFAAIVNLGFLAGFNWNGFAGLVPIGIGITAYGAAYALVHDVYIHRRLGWFGDRKIVTFDRLADAHRIHHLYNSAPYGMLFPVVPAELRDRASRTQRNPLAKVSASAPRSSSLSPEFSEDQIVRGQGSINPSWPPPTSGKGCRWDRAIWPQKTKRPKVPGPV